MFFYRAFAHIMLLTIFMHIQNVRLQLSNLAGTGFFLFLVYGIQLLQNLPFKQLLLYYIL